LAACALALSCAPQAPDEIARCVAVSLPDPTQPTAGMVFITGGAFRMGALPMHDEEGPPRDETVGDFWIDATEVTNAQFARFVSATNYVTLAERSLDPALYPGVPRAQLAASSLVFVQPDGPVSLANPGAWWRVVPGANWRHPMGPGTSIEGRDNLPVVHVAYDDALAYARWAGRDLPTEAEWEYAARGSLPEARYTWGDDPPGAGSANVWQGVFPVADTGEDGYRARASPVGCFERNGFGLYDMAGNVWEWTSTWYRPGIGDIEPSRSDAFDPAEPAVPKHVAKGGSFLCADNYCLRYRPAARTAGPPDSGSSHIGFRTIVRAPTGTSN
jgi:formylglycine-generating enzyme required for sulfatase activity